MHPVAHEGLAGGGLRLGGFALVVGEDEVGATAVQAGSGRWLIYSDGPAGNTFGNLVSGEYALWGHSITTHPPASIIETGHRYLFAETPSLTVTATLTDSKIYGDTYTFPAPVEGTNYTVSGFVDASTYGNVFAQDTLASIGLSGTPAFSSTGAAATATVAGSPYTVNIALGTLSNTGGYTFGPFTAGGALTVTPRAITVTANGGNSTYGDNPANPGLSATNLAAFDDVSDLTGLGNSFGIDGTTNVGTYTLTVTGTLTNANYQVTATSPGTWVVGRKALTVTADNQIKTYGDLFVFAGTEFSTEGLINGDQVLRALLASDGAINTASAAGSPYVITIGGATGTGLDNYTITYVPGRMVVTPGPTSFVRTALLETADMADPFSYLFAHPVEDDDLDSPPKGEIEFVPRDFPGTITKLSSGEVE